MSNLIDRQAVLSYIGRIQNQGTGKKKSFDFIKKFVEKLPSAGTPCDLCRFSPPGSGDGKPCTMCPASTNTEVKAVSIEEVEQMRKDAYTTGYNEAKTEFFKNRYYEGYQDGLMVLQDIRAEIDSYCSDNRDRNDGLYIAMKIIDKHLKEYEDAE